MHMAEAPLLWINDAHSLVHRQQRCGVGFEGTAESCSGCGVARAGKAWGNTEQGAGLHV